MTYRLGLLGVLAYSVSVSPKNRRLFCCFVPPEDDLRSLPSCDLASDFLRDNLSNDLNQSVRDAFGVSLVFVLLNDNERFVVDGLDFGVDNRRRLAMSGTCGFEDC